TVGLWRPVAKYRRALNAGLYADDSGCPSIRLLPAPIGRESEAKILPAVTQHEFAFRQIFKPVLDLVDFQKDTMLMKVKTSRVRRATRGSAELIDERIRLL